MKLIIDIPEEIYKASKIIDVQYEDVVQIPLEVIANGTPLDKIRDEIEQMRAKPDNRVKLIGDFISIDYVLGVINKYMEDKNER